jgi:hypothetical protein
MYFNSLAITGVGFDGRSSYCAARDIAITITCVWRWALLFYLLTLDKKNFPLGRYSFSDNLCALHFEKLRRCSMVRQ